MPVSDLPPVFIPLFVATFVANGIYVGCMFLLSQRLVAPVIKAKGFDAAGFMDGSPVELFRLWGFVFSGRHRELADPAVTRLVWAIRILLPIAVVMTVSVVFVLVLGAAS